MNKRRFTRRDAFRASGAAAAGLLAPNKGAAATPANVYTQAGVKPFINLTATYTINGGALTLAEVKRVMDEASRHSVNLDELMDAVGARIAEMLGAEAAIVTCGCAAALTHATSAAVAGGDPERMQQLPDLTGLRNRIVTTRQSRNQYDFAFRMVGVKLDEVETADEFRRALTDEVALVAVLGTGEASGKIRLEEMARAAHERDIPVIVDAAAELPLTPNPYLSRGADLVAYSGGKFLRGPQCAGLLLGRKDLVKAAWINSAPHHSFGRSMKVGKEEIMGMLAAVEAWKKLDLEGEYKRWESWYRVIGDRIEKIAGVSTRILPPKGASPFPVMEVAWDPKKVALTAGEVGRMLLEGEPRIMSHAEGEGHSFIIRPVSMQPGHDQIVAARLAEVLRTPAPQRHAAAPPAVDLSGDWRVTVEFVRGSAEHTLALKVSGDTVEGTHIGTVGRTEIRGTIRGNEVSLRSAMPTAGSRLTYRFTGAAAPDRMSGELNLGEYGKARWTAVRG
jgi:D-glucosaminate-6-phosphate ammonia-lyase